MKHTGILLSLTLPVAIAADIPYPIVDTGQGTFYDNSRSIAPPDPAPPSTARTPATRGNQPAYRDNGDGTVTDLVTGLMWQQDPGEKMTWEEAVAGAAEMPPRRPRRTGGCRPSRSSTR